MIRTLLMISTAVLFAACSDGEGTVQNDVTAFGNEAGAALPINNTSSSQAGTADLTGSSAEVFVTNAAISDLYEIDAGRLASEKGQSPQLKEFGQMMVKDHTGATLRSPSAGPAPSAILPTKIRSGSQFISK